jgi:hypothetical protein
MILWVGTGFWKAEETTKQNKEKRINRLTTN